MSEATLAYAKEVYAACATIGYDGEDLRRLKQMLDEQEGQRADTTQLVALAQQVQFASIDWARRTSERRR